MRKFDNYCAALENLKDIFEYSEPYSNVVLTGLVALYEICFEQSWKAMKEILEDQGFAEAVTGSPRQVLKTAYQAGMIEDEQIWLDALIARNNVAHSYNNKIAMDIVNQTKRRFYKMFCDVQSEIQAHWL
ncbi:MAG: HI0074 family nucleotidyltransferase substrate-binding subunit [Anaerostipes sp.]|jgi:nucleotidyltransferase substrate binding protein (TIGR01987 family)|nr:HI0074 family nucleotidyltransferase substrate-binding subunit [Anaerostipes sp.]